MLLAEQIGRRDNYIDQIRLGAALAVFLGHCWHISRGPGASVPLERILGIGFHEIAVFVFFFLSGLLIAESAQRYRGRLAGFVWARARRLLPALFVNATLIPVILMATGFWSPSGLTTLVEYAVRLSTLFAIRFTDTMAFADLPFSHAINGSVWSLRHEVILYALIGTGALGLPGRSRMATWLPAGLLMLWFVLGESLSGSSPSGWRFIIVEGRYLAFAGLTGFAAHRFAGLVVIHPFGVVPLALAALLGRLFLPEPAYIVSLIVLVSYLTLVFAYSSRRPGRGLPVDISYGAYIYAWPIQQMITGWTIQLTGEAPDPVALAGIAILPVLLAGWLSWTLIERPALSLKPPPDLLHGMKAGLQRFTAHMR